MQPTTRDATALERAPIRQPKYRDSRLNDRCKVLRASVKGFPTQERDVSRLEERLVYLDGLIGMWDDRWAKQALTEYRRGAIDASGLSAMNIFDDERRFALLRRLQPADALFVVDPSTADRVAEAVELEREVLQ